MSEQPGFSNYEEAWSFLERISEPRTTAFVKYGLVTALTRAGGTLVPAGKFDLLFLARLLTAMFEDTPTMNIISSGDLAAMDWWTDEE